MKEVQISREEWLAEFDRLEAPACGGVPDDGGLTTAEIVEATGMSKCTVLLRLKRAKALGILQIANTLREGLDGRLRPCQCYRIVRKEESTP